MLEQKEERLELQPVILQYVASFYLPLSVVILSNILSICNSPMHSFLPSNKLTL